MPRKLIALSAAIATLLISACGKSPEHAASKATEAPLPSVAQSPPPAPIQAPPPPSASTQTAIVEAAPAVAKPASTGTSEKPASPSNVPTTRPVAYGGIEFDLPLAWKSVQPENSMRLAQFEAAGKGKGVAELVVFYFPPGRGGSQQDNIHRWASQFTDDKGARVHPEGSQVFINNMAVTRVELVGNYSRGVGMGTSENTKRDQTLLVAIITTPLQANVTLHFFGPTALVKQNRERFDALLNSIRFKS